MRRIAAVAKTGPGLVPLRRALSRSAARLQIGSRARKWELYETAFPPRRGERVLDVGVSGFDDLPGENYFLRRYPYSGQVTAVGIDDVEGLQHRYPEIAFVRADGRELPFPDKTFDVVHSNAVIEHVGDDYEQARFVAELVRVSRTGFITTPNRWFPFETHCKLPLLHWLPRHTVHKLGAHLDVPDLQWWLLGARGFRRLFPPTVEVELHRTRALGWPLTLVALFRERSRDDGSTQPAGRVPSDGLAPTRAN